MHSLTAFVPVWRALRPWGLCFLVLILNFSFSWPPILPIPMVTRRHLRSHEVGAQVSCLQRVRYHTLYFLSCSSLWQSLTDNMFNLGCRSGVFRLRDIFRHFLRVVKTDGGLATRRSRNLNNESWNYGKNSTLPLCKENCQCHHIAVDCLWSII